MESLLQYADPRMPFRGFPVTRPGGPSGVADPKRAAEFARRYIAGDTLEAIAKDYSVSRERVRQVLRKCGVPSLGLRDHTKRKAEPLTEVEREAVRLYREGLCPSKISVRLRLPLGRVHRARELAGVPAQPLGQWNKKPDDAEITAEVARLYQAGLGPTEIVRRLHAAGLTTAAIAEALGRAVTYAYTIQNKLGLKPNRKPARGRTPMSRKLRITKPKIDAPSFQARDWTEDELATLREGWLAGQSAGQLSRLLNRSRNAVLGKIHRLGLNRTAAA